MTGAPSVLVTGSSSGVGRELAEGLARRGATVFASMRDVGGRNARAATELREIAEREQVRIHPVELDVASDESVAQGIAHIIETAGRIDVVINNAGLGTCGLIEATTIEQAQEVFNINLFGVMRVNKAVLPHMRRQQSGLLIYSGSVTSQFLVPFFGVYSATKAALEALAISQHYEVFSLGIDTVLLQLGTYGTNFGSNLQLSAQTNILTEYGNIGAMAQGFGQGMPEMKTQYPSPEELAEVVATLIAQPAGTRPLRVPVGFGSDVEAVNTAASGKQQEMINILNFGHLVQRETA